MKNYKNDLDFDINETIYFIHIPKTAGISFKQNKIINLGHCFSVPLNYKEVIEKGENPIYYSEKHYIFENPTTPHYKISIIRNPFDLLCSYYFHDIRIKGKENTVPSGWSGINRGRFKSFKEFIKGYCDPNYKWPVPGHKNFLFSQLFDIKNRCTANIIIKYEYIDEAIELLNKRLKEPFTIIKTNESLKKTENYKEYYDDEMIELVNEKCKRELNYFNYDFNGSIKHEPLIINCYLKYSLYKDRVYF